MTKPSIPTEINYNKLLRALWQEPSLIPWDKGTKKVLTTFMWLLFLTTLCSALPIPSYDGKASDLRHHGLDPYYQREWNHVGKVYPGHHAKSPIISMKKKRQANKGIDAKLDDINRNVVNVVNGITDLLKDILRKNEGNKVQDETNSSEAPQTQIISDFIPNRIANVAQVPGNIENMKTTEKSQNSSVLNIKAPVDVPSLKVNNNKPNLANPIGRVNAASNINKNKIDNVKDDFNKEQQINANPSSVKAKRFSDFKAFVNHDTVKEAVVDRIQHHESGVVKRQIAKPEFEVEKKHNKRHLRNPFLDSWKQGNPARNHEDESKRRHHLKPRVLHSNF